MDVVGKLRKHPKALDEEHDWAPGHLKVLEFHRSQSKASDSLETTRAGAYLHCLLRQKGVVVSSVLS